MLGARSSATTNKLMLGPNARRLHQCHLARGFLRKNGCSLPVDLETTTSNHSAPHPSRPLSGVFALAWKRTLVQLSSQVRSRPVADISGQLHDSAGRHKGAGPRVD